MEKRLFIYGLIALLLLLTVSCRSGRRRKTQTQGQIQNSRSAKVTPKKPETKKDTVYMVIPVQPDTPTQPDMPSKPVVKPDESDLIIIPSSKKLKPVIHKENLPYPPQIVCQRPTVCYSRDEFIENHNVTGDMKDLIIACDYDHPTVRNNTANLVHSSSGSFNLGQICDIFDFCYTNWSYVNDPVAREYYSKGSETLRNGLNGDCDDFAILLCSMILSIGGEARINFAYDATSGHAFSEVNIGKTNKTEVQKYLYARYNDAQMWHRKDNEGNLWLNLDWQAQYPGGEYWSYNRGTCFNIIRNIHEAL